MLIRGDSFEERGSIVCGQPLDFALPAVSRYQIWGYSIKAGIPLCTAAEGFALAVH